MDDIIRGITEEIIASAARMKAADLEYQERIRLETRIRTLIECRTCLEAIL